MARKENEGDSPYAYGAAGGAAKTRGCFSGKRKWAWIIGAIVLIAIIVGVAVGVSRGSSNKKTSKATGAVKSDPNDPSNFEKNPALHNSFWGMCYSPQLSQYPACGSTIESVIEDVQLLSQLTTRIRTYGADCNIASFTLQAIKEVKANMTAHLAAWVPQPADDPDNATWNRQKNEVLKAIQTYGADHVEGVTVGNEYLLNNGPIANLLAKIAEMRTAIQALNLGKTIPVGTADAGSMITEELAAGSDYIMANVHPWFGGVPIDQAASWVYSYSSLQEPSSTLQAPNNPALYIAEVGWPSGANDTASLTYQGAVAGIPQVNELMANYVCQANANITAGGTAADFSKYYYFSFSNSDWAGQLYGGVEGEWGLFDSDRNLKQGIVIPNCSHS